MIFFLKLLLTFSIISGLLQVEDKYDHCMVILADMPHITSRLINLLLRQYLASPLALGAIKTKNRRTHPVIIGRRFYDELHRLKRDVGARDLFMKYPDQICLVEPEEDYKDIDIDTMEDYLGIKKSPGNVPDSSDPNTP
ncbi:MAG: NTP transferase domain-containing protein [Desulfatiglandales bacterium]|nr:NTP transferase domain-containing protein [Desulfatiglandales bacterium]